MRNPVDAYQRAIERDRIANLAANQLGYDRLGLVKDGVYAIREPLREVAVNTGGFIGSQLGSNLGEQLAGDWLGAHITRRSIEDSLNTTRAIRQTIASPQYQQLPFYDKPFTIARNTYNAVANNPTVMGENMVDDSVGWAVGNYTAQAVPIPVPLRGASVALTYGKDIGRAVKRVGFGEPIRNVYPDLIQDIKERAPRTYRNGLNREQDMWNAVNEKLQQLPPNSIDFLNSYL